MKSVTLSKRAYQRNIPIFVCSFIIGLLVIQYLVKYEPIDVARGSVLVWSNIITLLVWSFAIVILIINNSMRLVGKVKTDRRLKYESAIILGTMIFFILLAFSDPKQEASATFSTVYLGIGGAITMATWAVAITHFSYNIWKRIVTSALTPEIIVFLLIYFFTFFREMTIVTTYFPQAVVIGDWIEKVPYATAMRAVTIITAVGTLIVALRALAGKEPGMIEMEVV